MPEPAPSRRAVLRTGTALGSLAALGSLGGCVDMLGGDDGTGKLDTVPANATTVLYADVAGFLGDDGVRESLNEQLSGLSSSADQVPDSVADALDRIESDAGLDPRKLNELVTFGEVGSDDSFGVVVWSDWSKDDLTSAAERNDAEFEEDSYEGKKVYSDGGDSVIGVLDAGTFTVGSESAVEAVIDVHTDNADPVGDPVRSAYEKSRNGYVRFAFDVTEEMIPDEAAGQFDLSVFENVETGHGSIATSGDAAFELTLTTSDADGAENVADVIDGAMAALRDQIENSSPSGPSGEHLADTVLGFVDDTDVTRNGTSVTVKTQGSVGDVVAIVGAVLGSFVLGLGETQHSPIPQVAFSFDYDESAGTVTITHDGGDTVAASKLYVRGTGFANASGADMTGPGRWGGSTSGETGGGPAVVAGDRVTVGVESDCELRVVYEGADRAATLAAYDGPDA